MSAIGTNSLDAEACASDRCPCTRECPLTKAMETIGGKWKIAILCSLNTDGATRYSALKRKIRGITNTMLAASLKDLEVAGLLSRTQYSEMPVRVEYSLTRKSTGLIPILRLLAQWVKTEAEPVQPELT